MDKVKNEERATGNQNKPRMKTLANCTPTEFLRQTNKIRHAAAGFMKETSVLELHKRRPKLTGKETDAEKKAALDKQSRKNLSDMADLLMDTNAEKGPQRHLGFIAQEYMEAEKAAGISSEDSVIVGESEGIFGLTYSEMIPILVAKIKQLEKRIEEVKSWVMI